jgi:hypothetical protein
MSDPYSLLVAPAKKAQLCQVWAAYFQRALPPLPVPLAKSDSDIPIDLQPMIDAIYKRSRYDRSIDYSTPLTPPLGAAENCWMEHRLQARHSLP